MAGALKRARMLSSIHGITFFDLDHGRIFRGTVWCFPPFPGMLRVVPSSTVPLRSVEEAVAVRGGILSIETAHNGFESIVGSGQVV